MDTILRFHGWLPKVQKPHSYVEQLLVKSSYTQELLLKKEGANVVYNEAKVGDEFFRIPSNIKRNFFFDEMSVNDRTIPYQSLDTMYDIDSGELELTSCKEIKRC
jgi:hypothetical protein